MDRQDDRETGLAVSADPANQPLDGEGEEGAREEEAERPDSDHDDREDHEPDDGTG